MKNSLHISNFLEEISSLSHSIVFLYLSALITEEGFLISPCYSLELCIQMGISFLFSFAFHFSSFHSRLTVLQFSSVAQLCPTLCNPMDCSTPALPVHHQFPEFTQTHVHWVSDAIQPSHPLSSLFLLPSNFPSIRVFTNESVLHNRWPKYWSFSLSSSPSNEYSGLISIRMDWLDLFAVQGTLKSLLQHCSSKASTLLHSAFFIVQISHPYITTGKTIALTRWTFVGKVILICCLGWS